MPLIIPSNSISGEFEVANSLRFDDGSSDYLSRTPSSAGNTKKWTWSCWFKKSDIPATWTSLIEAGASGSQYFSLGIDGSERLILASQDEGSGGVMNLWSSQLIRDISAWYHFVVAYDSAQATASDRVKGYINGEQITSFNTANYPAQNKDTYLNGNYEHRIGRRISGQVYNGYMAEVCLIDGQALDPTSFGEFDEDSGIWKPIDVSGLTFGTNGFYLDFENSGSLGADVSGNGNNFTVNNLTSVDQSTDTCTNNFATLNPLSTKATLSEGNTVSAHDGSATGYLNSATTIGMVSGKYYCECKITLGGSAYPGIGIASTDSSTIQNKFSDSWLGESSDTYAYYMSGTIYNNGSAVASGLSTFATNDIIGMAIDLDSTQNTLKFYKNGSLINTTNITTNSSGWFFASVHSNTQTSARAKFNFGSPSYSVSSPNSDGNGYGAFSHSVPSNYYSLNTKNLAEYG